MSSDPRPVGVAARVAVVLLVVGVAAVPGLVAAAEEPNFEVYVSEPTLTPGRTQGLVVQLLNDAEEVDERVKTARNVRVTMRGGGTPITVESGTILLGRLADGVPTDVSFRISVPDDIAAGTYELPITVRYEYSNDETGKQTLTARVRVEDRPRFAVVSTETDLSVGATGPINVTLRNVGSERATDATVTLTSRSASVAIGGGRSDARFAGSWAPGETKTVSFEGSVAGSAESQRYALAAQVTYEDANGNAGTSKSLSTGFVPQPSQFAIREVNSTLQVGADGRLSAAIVNRGSTAVSNVVVSFTPANPNVRPLETEYSVGRLGPGEAARFGFEVAIAENGGAGPRQFSFDVRYSRRDEASTSTDTIDVRADVAPEQRFRITDVESTLRVGEEGRLRATVVNPSETTVENAVVVIEPSSPTVNPVETEYAVGTLGPGGTATFDFAIEIAENADGGPRQFTLHVRYRDGDGDLRRSDPLSVLADIGQKRDAFAVEGVETTVTAGGSATLTVRVTNTGGTALSDVSAKLFTDSPLSADNDEAFIEELGPGESAEISFEVSAAGGATTGKVYPVSLDFQYVDADGDTLVSDTYKLPVRVQAAEGGGPPLAAIGGGLALVLVVGGYVLYRRR